MRKTKILATLGPASDEVSIIKDLVNAGMNAVRVNFSHGTYDSHRQLIDRVKQVREELNTPIPLILDTKGPEIRIKTFAKDKIYLEQGEEFTLTTEEIVGDEKRVSVTYPDLPKDLKKGDRVLIDDGLIELHVEDITETDVKCKIVNGGFISSRKGINIPDVYVNLPALTDNDINDILFGIENGFDYVAASFIRTAKDVVNIRHVLDSNNGMDIEIIAKIENRDGVNNIDEILEVANGIMVARGDLGVEIPPEEVPLVQKMLIKKANNKGKVVITATQMLESMVSNPRPTRAEANDVANAIFDGSDTLMLSGETARGAFPVESVMMMSRIASRIEDSIAYKDAVYQHHQMGSTHNITNAISFAACSIASDLGAKSIATVTKAGFTARMVSRFRPHCPIVACSNNEKVWRKLSLVWGCIPVLASNEEYTGTDMFDLAMKKAEYSGAAKTGDTVVVTVGSTIGSSIGSTNSIKVGIVGEILAKGRGVGKTFVSGRACVVKAPAEAEKYFKDGNIIVTNQTTTELLPYLKRAAAIVVGGFELCDTQHAEIVAQTLDIPLAICTDKVVDVIPQGELISVDPVNGFVYIGIPKK